MKAKDDGKEFSANKNFTNISYGFDFWKNGISAGNFMTIIKENDSYNRERKPAAYI